MRWLCLFVGCTRTWHFDVPHPWNKDQQFGVYQCIRCKQISVGSRMNGLKHPSERSIVEIQEDYG